eukprot:gene6887-9290_t
MVTASAGAGLNCLASKSSDGDGVCAAIEPDERDSKQRRQKFHQHHSTGSFRGQRHVVHLAPLQKIAHHDLLRFGIPDPAAATGTEAEVAVAFREAARQLRNRIDLLLALPISKLDRLSLQAKTREIGRISDEGLGTALLLMIVVGSGIMGERLAGGNDAIALLGNTLATGAGLVVLITVFGPLSGAHFNPAVTLVMALRREIGAGLALGYAAVQTV